MSSVCIIGAGELAGAVAVALARGGHAARIVLIDDSAGVAAGKALDIQQAGAIQGFRARLEGTADTSRVIGSAVCVVADRAKPVVEWHGDEGMTMVTRLASYLGESPIVFAGVSQASMIAALSQENHLARERLIGSAPEALIAAVKSMVAIEAQCSPSEIALSVLGVPPSGFVVPWSEASIGGCGVERVLTPVQLSRIESRVSHLWPPGPHTLGAAAARVVEGLLSRSRRTFSVLTVLGGEFGARGRAGVLPARLGPRGITDTRVPPLNTRERVRVENALGV